jgi:hypothetical protein
LSLGEGGFSLLPAEPVVAFGLAEVESRPRGPWVAVVFTGESARVLVGIPIGLWPQYRDAWAAEGRTFDPQGVVGSLVDVDAIDGLGVSRSADGADAPAAGRAAPGRSRYIGENGVHSHIVESDDRPEWSFPASPNPRSYQSQADLFGGASA